MSGKGGSESKPNQHTALVAADLRLAARNATGVPSARRRGRWSASTVAPRILGICICIALLQFAGCARTAGFPAGQPATRGMALHELPFMHRQPTGIEPGRYSVSVDVIYTATQEEATQRCNFGLPGGTSLACYLEANNIIITPVPRDSNDWAPMCYLGHEMTHGTHGAWHP